MNNRILLGALAAIVSITLSASANAVWELQQDLSHLHFVSVKNNSVGEVHEFKELKGTIESDGRFNLTIDTRSVETAILIRNSRMKKVLFESGRYPFAVLTGTIEYFNADTMAVGVTREISVPATLELHGVKQPLDTTLVVYKVNEKTIGVSLYKPMIISIADFEMSKGLQTLVQMAGLKSISTSVPITGHFVFKKAKTTLSPIL